MVRFAKILSTAVLLSQLVPAEAVPKSLTIELRNEVSVSERVYVLADVATVLGDADVGNQLAGVELGRAPRPGYWADLTRHEISARIERSLPGISPQITWSGAEVVRVGTVGIAQSAARIADFARKALLHRLYQRFERVDVQLINEPSDVIVPAGNLDFGASDLNEIVPTKRFALWVDLNVDGEHYQSLPVWFRITILEDVVTASRDLNRHDVVTAHDLRTATVDITRVRGSPLLDPNDVIGLRVLKPVAAGGVFVVGIAEPVPAIQEGQTVEVYTSAGRVTLRGRAIALSDGDLYDRVAVRSPSSGEPYFATVVGPGYVRVK
jgi:flagella basal body P-ring formation protein FlgA